MLSAVAGIVATAVGYAAASPAETVAGMTWLGLVALLAVAASAMAVVSGVLTFWARADDRVPPRRYG